MKALVVMCAATVLLQTGSSSVDAQSVAQVNVFQSDANHIVLELQVPAYELKTQVSGGTSFSLLTVPGMTNLADAGKPLLPIKGASLGIPQNAKPTLKILADDSRRESLTNPPLPASRQLVNYQPQQSLGTVSGAVILPDPAIYGGEQLYPADVAKVASVSNWRSQRYMVVEFHPLQYDPVGRQLVFHRRLQVEITFSYPGGLRDGTVGGSLNEGPFETILQQSLLNYSSAKNWRSKTVANSRAVSPLPRSNTGAWFKIAVDADGIYRITCPQLAAAGMSTAGLDPSRLQLYNQGTELAISVFGAPWNTCDSTDYFEFYAWAVNTRYTNTNIYWLNYGAGSGKRIGMRDGVTGLGSGTPVAAYFNTIHQELDINYRPYIPMADGTDHWYWDYLSLDWGNATRDYGFQSANLSATSATASAQVDIWAFSSGAHTTQVLVNGNSVGTYSWSGATELNVTPTFPQSYLIEGSNTIRIVEGPASGDSVYLNYFNVTYGRQLIPITDTIKFAQASAGNWQYAISGFTTPDGQVFDITDPFTVSGITSLNDSGPCACGIQFADTITAPHTYLTLTGAQRKTPVSITLDTNSSLRTPNNGADDIIIAYADFIPYLNSLVSLRQLQGLRVKVVDVQDVYDEFSGGLIDAQAIRDFLAYAYNSWQAPAPTYVLLVGDGNFDFKNHLDTGEPNYIPPFLRMVDPWIGETASDNRYVSFADADLPTPSTLPFMAIGRLPVQTVADVTTMIGKIVGYEQTPVPGNWNTKIAFVSDNTYHVDGTMDAAGDFWYSSDAIAGNARYINTPFTAQRIYYNPCDPNVYPQCALSNPPYVPYPDETSVRSAIVSSINDGRLIVNYTGHSAIQAWASESGLPAGQNGILFRFDEVNALSNGLKLPVMLPMTCYDGYFHYPGLTSIAEVNVRRAGGGALASWSASGLGVGEGHDYLDRGFFDAVMQQGVRQIGLDAVLGKMYLWANSGGFHQDLIDTYNLLGDPASRLAINAPTAAAIASFSGAQFETRAVLQWVTSSEFNLSGFNLLRSDSLNGFYSQVNSSLIPSRCPGCSTGSTYSYIDTAVILGHTYYYKLQSAASTGGVQVSSPISVTLSSTFYPLHLPLITR